MTSCGLDLWLHDLENLNSSPTCHRESPCQLWWRCFNPLERYHINKVQMDVCIHYAWSDRQPKNTIWWAEAQKASQRKLRNFRACFLGAYINLTCNRCDVAGIITSPSMISFFFAVLANPKAAPSSTMLKWSKIFTPGEYIYNFLMYRICEDTLKLFMPCVAPELIDR